MKTINNVHITVTKIINAPGQGVLAAGYIEDGLVHVGDFLQVHNHHPGVTARVGRISIGSKVVKEAHSGSDAMFLLERIEETEIRPGDRLLPGQETELRGTDEESWEKLPERIEPIVNVRQFVGKFALLAALSIFWIIPIFIIISMIGSNVPILVIAGFFLFWYGIVGYITFGKFRDFVNGLRGRRKFLEGQTKTIAKILRRRVVEQDSNYGTSYTFHLQLEFTPVMISGAGVMRLEASISKKLYETLWESKTVGISYAVEDPRIFLIDGE